MHSQMCCAYFEFLRHKQQQIRLWFNYVSVHVMWSVKLSQIRSKSPKHGQISSVQNLPPLTWSKSNTDCAEVLAQFAGDFDRNSVHVDTVPNPFVEPMESDGIAHHNFHLNECHQMSSCALLRHKIRHIFWTICFERSKFWFMKSKGQGKRAFSKIITNREQSMPHLFQSCMSVLNVIFWTF